ncbi:MAG: hypothetical protein V2A76_07160 [Planctomycetota bacterium]
MKRGRFAVLAVQATLLLNLGACGTGRPDAAFDSQRSLAEVVATLQDGMDRDLYRFDPPTDLTGENLFRASLARLARYEDLVADPGFLASIRFARARAEERMLNFEAARSLYEEVAAGESELAERAREYGEFAGQMAGILNIKEEQSDGGRPDELLLRLAEQRQRLRGIADALADDPRLCLVKMSIERLDVREREFLWRTRALFPGGSKVALDAARELVQDHVESRRVLEHSLRLADMYAELVRAYVAAVDPGGYDFDATYARNLIQLASQIYAEVAAVDGRTEREEARAALVSMEALADRIRGG